MHTPNLLIVDVNETLLSLDPLKDSVGRALNGRVDLLPLWFSTMLHYSLVETLSGTWHDFGGIGTAALRMVAEAQGIALTHNEARDAVVPPLNALPPHPDAVAGVTALRSDGRFRLVTLTNSSNAGAKAKLEQAGLFDLFDAHYTVESLQTYKPHPDTYRTVLDDLHIKPEQAMMVAAHAWDLMGAKSVGLQTAFIARPGKTLYPNAARPNVVVNNLLQLAEALKQQNKRA